MLTKSVNLQPNENFVKYLSLAQLMGGHDSLRAYQKGVELVHQEIQRVQSGVVRRNDHRGRLACVATLNPSRSSGLTVVVVCTCVRVCLSA